MVRQCWCGARWGIPKMRSSCRKRSTTFWRTTANTNWTTRACTTASAKRWPRSVTRLTDRGQRFADAVVQARVVQFVFAVVRQKVVERFLHELLIFGIPQRAPHQHWRTIAYVGSNQFAGQFGLAEVPEHSIDRVDQVELRVDQGAV